LRDIRGVRRELVRLFREGKAGLIDPQLFGRLTHCLNTLQAIDRGAMLEERLATVEAQLKRDRRVANGHDRHAGDETGAEIRPS
jgi:hypothetical protein